MTHVTCRLTAQNRDQLRNPMLGNRVWTTLTFLPLVCCSNADSCVKSSFLGGSKCRPGSFEGESPVRHPTSANLRPPHTTPQPHHTTFWIVAKLPTLKNGPLFGLPCIIAVLFTFSLQTKFEMSSFVGCIDAAWARKCRNGLRNRKFIPFSRTATCDRRTDGRTDGHRALAYTALA